MSSSKVEHVFDELYHSLSNQKEWMVINDDQLRKIGKYPERIDPKTKSPVPNYVDMLLDPEGKERLYKGISEYQKQHPQKVEKFIIKHPNIQQFNIEEAKKNPYFFRQQLAEYCQKIRNSDQGYIAEELKKHYAKSPQKATTTMKEFLGPAGAALAKLALEEEMNSKEYMDEVFNDSVHVYPGPKWIRSILAFVGGPSSSGKTTAAASTFTEVTKTAEKSTSDLGQNYEADIDGALSRGRFVQSLLKQTAESKGFCGISDMHSKSLMLERVKVRLYDAVLSTKDLSACIPETFANIASKNKLMWFIDTLARSGRLVAFGRVTCDQEAVKKMGQGRAYTYSPKEKHGEGLLDMYGKTEYESKNYDSKGYIFGNLGSQIAESIYQCITGSNSLLLNNDLVLKKEDPNKPGHWIDATSSDSGAILVSQRVFNDWIDKKPHNPRDQPSTLPEYIKVCGRQPPEVKRSPKDLAVELIANSMLEIAEKINNHRLHKTLDKLIHCTDAVEQERL